MNPNTVTIITNGHIRELVALADIPASDRAEFDYIEVDDRHSPRLFNYLGAWYDVNEFTRVDAGSQWLAGWDGVQGQSYFSAVLIKWATDWSGDIDYDSVIVGRSHW